VTHKKTRTVRWGGKQYFALVGSESELDARDRTVGGITAPPEGLYLTAVDYPAHFNIPRIPVALGLW
jgi:hypothetical protein